MAASLSIRPNWQFKFRFFHSEFYGKNPFDVGCMSTMEAVASCIRVLETNSESEISSEEVEVLRAVSFLKLPKKPWRMPSEAGKPSPISHSRRQTRTPISRSGFTQANTALARTSAAPKESY